MDKHKESYSSQPIVVSSTTEPTVDLDYSLLSQYVKTEPQSGVLNSVKNEDVSSTVKIEILSPVASPVDPSSVKSEDTRCSATTSPALTTELESFQDLTEWCRKASKTPNMSFPTGTDELNTPVPEFGDFWFPSPTMSDHNDEYNGLLNVLGHPSPELYTVDADIQSTNKLNDLDSQIFGIDSTDNFNNIKSETYQYSNVLIGGGAVQESLKAKNVPCMNNYNNSVYTVHSGLSQQTSVYSKSTTEMQSSSTEEILSVAQSSSFIELPVESNINFSELVSFPLESVVPQVPTERRTNLPRLDFSNIWGNEKQVLSTPEVINTALSLETTDFSQLVSIITDEKIVLEEVSPSTITNLEEEDSRSGCPSTSVEPDPLYSPSETEDDDEEEEEYVPPSKKRKTPSKPSRQIRKTKSPFLRIDQDSETSNASTVESFRPARRGRPPKRNVSISSDSNADPEMSRYRELRDKNNEASRRSRQNRKQKELEMENEAKDLDVRNRKLKVRVHELERLVTTMRTNLMQMLLKK